MVLCTQQSLLASSVVQCCGSGMFGIRIKEFLSILNKKLLEIWYGFLIRIRILIFTYPGPDPDPQHWCCGSGSSRIRNLKHYRGYGSGNGSETFPSFDTDPDIDLKNSDKSDLDQKWNQYTTLLKMSFRSIGGYKSLREK